MWWKLVLGVLSVFGLATACAASSRAGLPTSGRPSVVVAENTWGSLAAQLGGDRLAVTSVVANSSTDPHDYEPNTGAARLLASARYVIYNGAGYDPWVGKLLAANPVSGRRTLDIGRLVGVRSDGNPHRWYAPDDVSQVIDQITADFKLLLPTAASYFDAQRANLVNSGLVEYRALIRQIRTAYAGVPLGASESIFAPLADALGLRLVTPPAFLAAISEGSEPSTSDKVAIDAQIAGHQIKVYVFNRQNATPDIQRQLAEARAAAIPIVSIAETLTPAGSTFQEWQVAQLRALESALSAATNR